MSGHDVRASPPLRAFLRREVCMTRLTEALRSEWLAMLLLVACLIGLGVLGIMAP